MQFEMSVNIWFIILMFVCFVPFCINYSYERRYAIKVYKTYKDKILQVLKDQNFSMVYEITPETSIIEYGGNDSGSNVLRKVSGLHQNQIISWEPVRLYNNTLTPASDSGPILPLNQSIIDSMKNYGMSVEDAWDLGLTGKGVKIAVNDVGINVNLLDLKNTIDISLSYNFIERSMDVAPEDYIDMSTEAVERADHGNRIGSVISAERNNTICYTGIAFGANLAALKIFRVNSQSGQWTSSEYVGQSFVHKLTDIDIFVNAWRPTEKFDPLDLSSVAALEYGAKTGRRGLGTIYLVPSGTTGNLLSNNIYTITVGGIGVLGTVPSTATVDASVITSGLSMGNNLTARFMVTASKNNKCITTFNGTSLATAQIAGIIAMGMEVNKYLSQRDILHLLVKASERSELREANKFQKNGGGLYVHKNFGFGLLNAKRFVLLAEHAVPTPESVSTSLTSEKQRNSTNLDVSFCFQCSNVNEENCVTLIEYVEVSVKLVTDTSYLMVTVISPSTTESLLMEDKVEQTAVKPIIEGSFVSSHFWDELPFGLWKIKLNNRLQGDTTTILDFKITFHGTHSQDSSRFEHVNKCEEISLPEEPKRTTEKPVENSNTVPWYVLLIVIIFFVVLFVIVFSYVFWSQRNRAYRVVANPT